MQHSELVAFVKSLQSTGYGDSWVDYAKQVGNIRDPKRHSVVVLRLFYQRHISSQLGASSTI